MVGLPSSGLKYNGISNLKMFTIDTRIREGSVEFLLHPLSSGPETNEAPVSGVLRGQFQFLTGTQEFQLEWRHKEKAEEPAGWGAIPIPESDEPLCEVNVHGVEDQNSLAVPFELGCHRVAGLWFESEEQVAASLFRPGDRVQDDETLAFQVDQLLRYADWRRETAAPLAVMLAYKSVEGHAPDSSMSLAQEVLSQVIGNIELLQPDKEHRKDREQIRLSATMALVHVLLMRRAYAEIEPVIDRALNGFRPSSKANPFHHGENRTRLLLLKSAVLAHRGDRSESKEYRVYAHYAAQEALIHIKPSPTFYGIANRIMETVRCALGELRPKDVARFYLRLRRPTEKAEKLIKKRLVEYLEAYVGQETSSANGQPSKVSGGKG